MELNHAILSDVVVWSKYAKYLDAKNRRETWEEIVTRNKEMHIKKFPYLETKIEEAYELVYAKKVLPSMRSLQFGGLAIEVNNARLFNCSYLHIDDYRAFNETMFLLMSGTGVGYSVSRNHVSKLPPITKQLNPNTRNHTIGDSIEGWADAIKVLMQYYFGRSNWKPEFDYSAIRPKGARLRTAGGLAPGPDPLRICLDHIVSILDRKEHGEQLSSLECHDILCHIAHSVLSGGIRRSAMIALFDHDDQDMLTCKFGRWYDDNPQRGRANNSAKLLRGKIDKSTFLDLWKKVEESNSGEPGFFFTNDLELGTNPCAEIGLNSFQFCNLVEINASDITDQHDFETRADAAAFIGTLQASYTKFRYLRPEWQEVTEREALLGVGMTGIASGRVLDLDMHEAAETAVRTNKLYAKVIGIKEAARITTVKPSGTSSLVLGTSSGIHAWHDEYYIRRMRINKNDAIYTYLSENHSELLEDDVTNAKLQSVISLPIAAPKGAITRSSESAIAFLERIKLVHEKWIKPGHIYGENTHNVSATVTLKDNEWKVVGEWLWENQNNFNGLSFMPADLGSYEQTPFETITKEQYEQSVTKCNRLDVAKVVEFSDNTTLNDQAACGGGACEIL
jgi:ribonucleoside-diphosphate reductase alpha chain